MEACPLVYRKLCGIHVRKRALERGCGWRPLADASAAVLKVGVSVRKRVRVRVGPAVCAWVQSGVQMVSAVDYVSNLPNAVAKASTFSPGPWRWPSRFQHSQGMDGSPFSL